MADMRFLKSDHERAEFRLAQPLRHLAAQYASLGPRAHVALAGDDEDEGEAIEMRAAGKQRVRGARAPASFHAGRALLRYRCVRAGVSNVRGGQAAPEAAVWALPPSVRRPSS